MYLPRLARLIYRRLKPRLSTPPDVVIGGTEHPYLLRWYITPWSRYYRSISFDNLTRWQRFVRSLPNVYLHWFLRSDDPRALHDHPWNWGSFLLEGEYSELCFMGQGGDRYSTVYTRQRIQAGSLRFSGGAKAHRIELTPYPMVEGQVGAREMPCVTLFMTGHLYRIWGFHCPKGWIPFYRFTKPGAQGEIGPGCDG